MKTGFMILVSFLVINIINGQSQEQAIRLAKEAVSLMSEGDFENSIDLLEQAIVIDTSNYNLFQYEIAYAYYLQKDYTKSIQEIEKITNKSDSSFEAYQLLGNAQDLLGEEDEALKTYQIGMIKYPEIGNFYLESGIIEYARDDFNKAIEYWEKGIKIDPNYPSNYYQLAKIFSLTEELIWSILYSEIFINLEPTSKRTDEISKLLYSVYQRSYISETDSSGQFNLTKKGFEFAIESDEDLQQTKDGILPFEGSVATIFSSSAISFMTQINYQTIYESRKNFILNWFNNENISNFYENSLFKYQKVLIDKGLFESYTYWLISAAEPDIFDDWFTKETENFKEFSIYFDTNSLKLTESDLYSRRDY